MTCLFGDALKNKNRDTRLNTRTPPSIYANADLVDSYYTAIFPNKKKINHPSIAQLSRTQVPALPSTQHHPFGSCP
jgi:hypothetical protein